MGVETRQQAIEYLLHEPSPDTEQLSYARHLLLKQPVRGVGFTEQPSTDQLLQIFQGPQYTTERYGIGRKDEETITVSFQDTERQLSPNGELNEDAVAVVQRVTFNNLGLPISIEVKRNSTETAMPSTRMEMTYTQEMVSTEEGNVPVHYLRTLGHYFDIGGRTYAIQDITFKTPQEFAAAKQNDPDTKWGEAAPQEVLSTLTAMMPNQDALRNSNAQEALRTILANPDAYSYMHVTGGLERGEVLVPIFARGPLGPFASLPEYWRFSIEDGRIVKANYHYATDMTPHELATPTDPSGESIAGMYSVAFEFDYTYDSDGQLESRLYTDLMDGTRTSYTYTRNLDGSVQVNTVDYDAQGNVVVEQ